MVNDQLVVLHRLCLEWSTDADNKVSVLGRAVA